MIDADVMSCLYSPTHPSSVDVYFAYHRITHLEFIEFDCRLMYRLHAPLLPSDRSLNVPAPNTAPRAGVDGWRLMFEVGFADLPPSDEEWKPVDQTEWGLTTSDLDAIRIALFGAPPSTWDGVGNLDVVRLLMAAVGIPFGVATEEDDEDTDGQDPAEVGTILWELDHEQWIALNIRKVCGVPLERDASWKPRVPVIEYESESEEEEDDGDESDD